MTKLAERLEGARVEIEDYARKYGLDFYPTIFETVSPREMLVVAARDGFPSRYEHWRFGMEYRRLKTHFNLGAMRIYELVLNNNPSLAYMLNDNNDVNNKLVMAHVFAHVDFFKNNLHFQHTDRNMIDEMANHKRRIKQYSRRYGVDTVDDFVDNCLSISNLINFQTLKPPTITRPKPKKKKGGFLDPKEDEEEELFGRKYLRDDDYMEWWLEEMVPKHARDHIRAKEEDEEDEQGIPKKGVRDMMLFLLENAPLKDWEVHTLSMIRDETYYFAPQLQTKIMNEGWATYWHTKIMRGEGMGIEEAVRRNLDIPLRDPILDFSEIDLYAGVNSGVLTTSPMQLNPYKLGFELYKDIEERWNRGLFGREYEECSDFEKKLLWDTGLNEGRDFIFQVRELYNDFGFLNRFLTKDFCRKQKLFIYEKNPDHGWWYEISDRDWLAIKAKLLNQLTNAGEPIINITDDNYKNRGELYLTHEHPGAEEFDLRVDHAKDTLKALQSLWRRPVHIETILEEQRVRYTYDGETHTLEELEPKKKEPEPLLPWMS